MSDLSRVSRGGTKTCPRCGTEKSITDFYTRKTKQGVKPSSYCKPCQRSHASALNCPKRRRELRLRRDFGISLDEYDALLEQQDNGCAICGKTPEENGKRLAVDHNHATGEVRGLLCTNCNSGIGKLGDSPARLRLAIRYLEERGNYADD